MHKERKETTHARVGKRNIHQHIKKISTMYVKNGHKTYVQDINVSKKEKRKKKDTINPHYIPQILIVQYVYDTPLNV